MEKALRNKGYNEKTINEYVSIFQSSEDNKTARIGRPQSPRLYIIEIISDWLKWFFPPLLLSFGIALFLGYSLTSNAHDSRPQLTRNYIPISLIINFQLVHITIP